MLGKTNSIGGFGGGSDTYEADLVLLGVVDGLPQPTEEEVVNQTVPILKMIITGLDQTVTPTADKNGYLYTLILHSEDLMLPILFDNGTVTKFAKVTNEARVNGMSLDSNGNWVLTVAEDSAENMTYVTTGGKLNAQMSYTRALQINWDEGHLVDGHASVQTSRFAYDANGNIIDTYTGNILDI